MLLRLVSVVQDIPTLYDWLNAVQDQQGISSGPILNFLNDYYTNQLLSDGIQPFLVLLDDMPVLEVELLAGVLGNLQHSLELSDDDITLVLLTSPYIENGEGIFLKALELCLSCFFAFEGVHRILCEIHPVEKLHTSLITQAGFRVIEPYRDILQDTNLFAITKENFIAQQSEASLNAG